MSRIYWQRPARRLAGTPPFSVYLHLTRIAFFERMATWKQRFQP